MPDLEDWKYFFFFVTCYFIIPHKNPIFPIKNEWHTEKVYVSIIPNLQNSLENV